VRTIGIGLLVAAVTGAGAWLFAHPFLTSHVAHLAVPLLGTVHVPSTFFFDLGVFALVLGATSLILIALAHQSLRAHRTDRPEPGGLAAERMEREL
jgi:multicomponent K+:H+ antiporter subunit A